MTTTRLVLASESRFKRDLFARLALPHEAIAADIDESVPEGESPRESASRLSREKVLALAERLEEPAWIVGGDQIIALEQRQFRKPGSREACIQQLLDLQDRSHDLFCGVALHCPDGRLFEEVVHVEMQMRPLTRSQIEDYVDRDMPTDCAGSYMLEQGGVRLFSRMRCDDYTAIVGLPLTRCWDLLEQAGYLALLDS